MGWWIVVAFLALVGCGDEKTCTAELRTAVAVHVASPQGLPVSSVTAARLSEHPCEGGSTRTTAFDYRYDCYEQGEGVYTVRVKSEALTWTKQVAVSSDGCHVDTTQTLDFTLDPATAD